MSENTIDRDCDGTYVDQECANRKCKNAEYHCTIREKVPKLTDAELVDVIKKQWPGSRFVENVSNDLLGGKNRKVCRAVLEAALKARRGE